MSLPDGTTGIYLHKRAYPFSSIFPRNCMCLITRLITTLIRRKIRLDRAAFSARHDSIRDYSRVYRSGAKLIRRAKGRKSIKPQ